jgi:predicted nucleic acid-binding Zn ribbon protein
MARLKSILKSALEEAGIEKAVEQNRALIIWEKAVGNKIAANTEAINVRHGVLTVQASTPAWRQELLFKKSKILEKLNTHLEKETIKDIRFI